MSNVQNDLLNQLNANNANEDDISTEMQLPTQMDPANLQGSADGGDFMQNLDLEQPDSSQANLQLNPNNMQPAVDDDSLFDNVSLTNSDFSNLDFSKPDSQKGDRVLNIQDPTVMSMISMLPKLGTINESFAKLDDSQSAVKNSINNLIDSLAASRKDSFSVKDTVSFDAKNSDDDVLNNVNNKVEQFNTEASHLISLIQTTMAESPNKEEGTKGLTQKLNSLVEEYKTSFSSDKSKSELKKSIVSLSTKLQAIISSEKKDRSEYSPAANAMVASSSTPSTYAYTPAPTLETVPGAEPVSLDESSQSLNQMVLASGTTSIDPLYLAMMLFIVLSTGQAQVCNTDAQMLQTNKATGNMINYVTSAFTSMNAALPITVTYSIPSTTVGGDPTVGTVKVNTMYQAFALAFGTSDGKGSTQVITLPEIGKDGTPIKVPAGTTITSMSPNKADLQASLQPMLTVLQNVNPTEMNTVATDGWDQAGAASFNDAVTQMYNYVNAKIVSIDPSLAQMLPLPTDGSTPPNYLIYSNDPTLEKTISTNMKECMTSGQAASTSAGSTSSQLTMYLQANMAQYSNLMNGASNSLSMLKALYRSIWAQ